MSRNDVCSIGPEVEKGNPKSPHKKGLACDFRVATDNPKTQIGLPETQLGIIPGWGGTQRLARVCGLGVAKDLILTGRVVDAKEARRIGLVNDVFEPDELMETTLKIAQLIASKGPLALAEAKAAINHSLQGDYVESLDAEAQAFGELFSSNDAREGMTAFVEKRAPNFTGK
jgi:enoyl-CoA hydratase